MSVDISEPVNKWRLLHELILKAKEAKDLETLGAVMDQMDELIHKTRDRLATGEHPPFYNELCAAYDAAQEKMQFWRANPPPIAPQETQIGPGNPFPIPPPPPPPTVAGEEFISLEFLLYLVKEAKRGSGDCFALWLPRLCEELNRWASANAKTPKVEQGKWTGALVCERIAPKGLTNPVGYRAATPEEQAELDRIARAINRNTPLFEPPPQAPGSLEAQNAKAIESAAAPVKTPEPWTVDRLKLIFDEHDTIFDLDDDVADLIVSIFNDENNKRGKNMGYSTHAAEFPELWTGEELYFQACKELARTLDPRWAALNPLQKHLWLNAAKAANERMGVVYK